jgi:hypothetical protein
MSYHPVLIAVLSVSALPAPVALGQPSSADLPKPLELSAQRHLRTVESA